MQSLTAAAKRTNGSRASRTSAGIGIELGRANGKVEGSHSRPFGCEMAAHCHRRKEKRIAQFARGTQAADEWYAEAIREIQQIWVVYSSDAET